ncbi:unnamed protein product [Somion occarium]|uniref:Uncharacterized protein n=1 Tax=Somion occarium TaxID=3059160 RepID=A0ABP1DTI2_9APHY
MSGDVQEKFPVLSIVTLDVRASETHFPCIHRFGPRWLAHLRLLWSICGSFRVPLFVKIDLFVRVWRKATGMDNFGGSYDL